MCWGELSAVIAWLTSKCLWSGWKWYRRFKEIASAFLSCPVNVCEKKPRLKKGLVMIVSNIFGPLYITLTFTQNTHDNQCCYLVDNSACSFNKCNFGIRSGFKKKTRNFSNSVKWNTFGEFQFITLRVEKHFAWPVSSRKLSQVRCSAGN